MTRPLRVLFVPTSNSGVSFYRFWNFSVAANRTRAMLANVLWWQKDLNEIHPWETEISEPGHGARIINEIWERFLWADVVVFQMVHTHAALDIFLSMKEAAADAKIPELREKRGIPHRGPTPVVVEIDDNMLSTADYNPASAVYGPGSAFRDIAVSQFKAADAMIVSTPYLKDLYSDLNDSIEVVPNCLDFKIWGNLRKKKRDGIRIGWAGGASHEGDLKIIELVVHNILKKHKEARFVFVHGIPKFLRNIPRVECVDKFSRVDKYPAFLAQRGFDIGIAPLMDNAFNRGKSNLRWLEYAGLGIPCVASNVGHFKETLRHGEDALLADTPEDFEAHLSRLIENKSERKAMGQRAYRRAAKDFNTDAEVFRYAEILKGIADRGQIRPIEQPEYAQPLAEQRISSPEVYS